MIIIVTEDGDNVNAVISLRKNLGSSKLSSSVLCRVPGQVTH